MAVGVEGRFGAEIDLRGEEPGYDVAQHVPGREAAQLVAEFELLEDVLNVVGEAV